MPCPNLKTPQKMVNFHEKFKCSEQSKMQNKHQNCFLFFLSQPQWRGSAGWSKRPTFAIFFREGSPQVCYTYMYISLYQYVEKANLKVDKLCWIHLKVDCTIGYICSREFSPKSICKHKIKVFCPIVCWKMSSPRKHNPTLLH